MEHRAVCEHPREALRDVPAERSSPLGRAICGACGALVMAPAAAVQEWPNPDAQSPALRCRFE
ncbi:MAG: hypothetical protein ACM3S1_03880 [Hyphomicrobiales bacterium]